MREFCPRKQGVSRGLRPNLFILNKGAITSLSLFKPFSSNRVPQNAIPPPWYLVSQRHICAIPHFATYRAIIVRYPAKTRTKEFCDSITASYSKYRAIWKVSLLGLRRVRHGGRILLFLFGWSFLEQEEKFKEG